MLNLMSQAKPVWLSIVVLFSVSVSAEAEQPEFTFNVTSFDVKGELPLSDKQVQDVLAPFLGDHSGIVGLQAAGDALEGKLKSKGYAFFSVSLPPQKLNGGKVILKVFQSRINKVRVEGNRVFSEKNIRSNVPALQENGGITPRQISRSVNLANQSPSKTLKVTFSNSDTAGFVDAKVAVEDSKPWNAFVGVSNTGSEQTGDWRTNLGLQYNNVLDRDHTATLAYTTNPEDVSSLSQFALSYKVPFFASGTTLNAYYSLSDIDTGLVPFQGVIGQDLFIQARGVSYGLSVGKELIATGRLKQNVSLSLDDRLFENDTQLGGAAIGNDIRSTPLVVRYNAIYPYNKTSWSAGLQYAKNLEFGSNNNDAAYSGNIPGSLSSEWDKWLLKLGVDHGFGKGWVARVNISNQFASQTLISGEQFGIGGANSIRGYDERVAIGDSGYQASAELWLPPFTKHKISSLFFYDTGVVERDNDAVDDITLSSAGIGFRWAWKQALSVRLDVGSVFEDLNTTEKGDVKVHLNLFWRF